MSSQNRRREGKRKRKRSAAGNVQASGRKASGRKASGRKASGRKASGRKASARSSRAAELEARGQLDRLTNEILELKRRTARDLYSMGLRLTRIRDGELWRAGPDDSFDAYLNRGLDIGRSTAYELMGIARHFNAEIAARYGPDKLRATLVWMQATPADELPGDVFAADIRLRASASGRFVKKPLHEATASEIREATVLLRDARYAASASRRVPKRVKQRLGRLAARLPTAPRGTRAGERLRVRRGADGRLAVTFQAIPLDELDQFIEALRGWRE